MRCPQHPDRHAVAVCTVCGDRLCAECAPRDALLQAPVCATCAPTVPAAPPPAPRRRVAPLIGAALLGVLGGWLLLRPTPPPPPVDPAATLALAVQRLEDTTAAIDAWQVRVGDWPDDLAALGEPPADPFAPGRALRFGPAPARSGALTVWSVGPDGIDHGGSPLDPVTGRGDIAVPIE